MGRSLGIDLKEIEKILENISKYRSDEEYEDFFTKVDELDGFVRGIGIHAGGIVVSDLDIEKEFGVITSIDKDTGKVRRVSQLDMKELDELGYVKVDALGLTTIGVINRACDYIGIDRPHPDNIDFEDDKVWNHLLETDGTLIFQFEKDQAYGYLKKALTNITNMTRIDIATAVSGIIRPCGDHIRNDFFAGKQNDTGSEVVNKYFIRNNGYLIYQEDFMNFLTYFAGYSNAESDIVRKKISKKSGMDEVVDELQDRFPKYFMEHFGESEASARAVLSHVGQVLLDASLYGFNICHARPYTTTGYVCMWLRYYYPKEFITAALNEFNKKKEKVKDIYKYMNKYTNIKIESPVMGQASMDYSYDKEKDIIYEGMFGLKGVSKNVESALQQLPNDCNSFLDLLIYIKTNKIKMNVRDIRTLTKIDFFRKFGTQKLLLDIIDIYFDIVKYNPNLKTQETKDKKIATMNEMISLLNKDEDLPFATKMFNELSIRGTTSKRMDWIKDDAIFVVDIKQPYPSYHLVKGFNLKTGDINEYRISRNDMIHSVKKDDIISIIRQEKKERKQLVEGHWMGTGNYYDAIISFSKVILD